MHITFNPDTIDWNIYTQNVQWGDGFLQAGGYTSFRGMPYQRGGGIGSVFKSFMRFLLPLGKRAGIAIGRQGLETGNKILSSILEGKSPKDSIIEEGKEGIKSLLSKAAENVGKQKGGGITSFKRRKTIKSKQGLTSHKQLRSIVGPPSLPLFSNKKTSKPSKRSRKDSLGIF